MTETQDTNTVDVFIGEIKPEITKAVDKTQAAVGDIITYTLTFKNNGGTPMNNVVLTDIVPTETTFVAASVKVDGVPDISADPAAGVNIGTVAPNTSKIVTFTVTMNNVPIGTVATNNATADFDYTINSVTSSWPTITSNNVTTTATYATLSIVKTQSKAYADMGATVTYSLVVKNNGNVAADNVIITDTDPIALAFVGGTVKVDGIPNVTANPNTGINIGTINPGASKTITFDVQVNNIPTGGTTTNTGTGAFEYTVLGSKKTGTATSNALVLNINDATLVMNKSVNPQNATIGDTVTYTVTLQNTGNTAANTVVLTDTLPSEVSFNVGSVIINGAPDGSVNPNTGINIATIAAGATATVTFTVTVNSLPTVGSVINNSASSTFKYTIDPAQPNAGGGTSESNIAPLNTGIARTLLTKSVDKAYADVGDVLTYTIDVKNDGNVDAKNIILTDVIPNGTTLVPDSFSINGVPQIGVTPNAGTNIGTVQAGTTVQIIFKVTVNSIPTPNPVPNKAATSFEYAVGSSNFTGGATSNTVTTKVNHAEIGNLNKTATAYAAVGQTVNYSIVIPNIGNVLMNNVVLKDILPSAVTYVAGSAKVNGIAASGTPALGINVGAINAGSSSTVTFDAVVNSIPNPNPMQNTADVTFTYTVDPAFPDNATGQETSNQAPTTVNFADLIGTNGANFVKTVDKAFAKVGDVLTYTITMSNTGNTAANNVVVTDVLPAGTSFVAGSVTVNGGPGSGTPNTGITVPSIAPSATATVTFNANVTSIPIPNPISNTANVNYKYTIDPSIPNGGLGSGTTNAATTQVNFANIAATKAVDKINADVGDVLTYTVSLTNNGNVSANNVVINDILPAGTSFVIGSVVVGGVPQPTYTPSNVTVGSIAAGATKIITYKTTVTTIPLPNPIVNNADVKYTYTVNPSIPNGESVTTKTTDATTTVGTAKITMTKLAMPKDLTIGDVVTYSINLTNIGNVAANNILFKDILQAELSFIVGSVVVGGVPNLTADPTVGFNITTLAAGSSVTITFTATAVDIPIAGIVVNNKATVDFKYTVDPLNPNGKTGTSESNIEPVNVGIADINMTKKVDKTFADIGDTLTYTVTLLNVGNVEATNVIFTDLIPNGTSFIMDSLLVNGVAQIGANPAAGYNIGNIAAGSSIDVEFKVKIDTIPNPNPIINSATTSYGYTVGSVDFTKSSISNEVSTKVNHGEIPEVTKTAIQFATINQVITYTLKIPNTGNVPVNSVMVTDIIPSNTSFVIGSIKINGNPGTGTPDIGIPVGTIAAGTTTTVTFDIKVNSYPPVNPMVNTADVSYKYTVDPAAPNSVSKIVTSNEAETTVNYADLIGANGENFVKTVDKAYAKVGDIITYTLILKNTGNVFANNIVVTDVIPAGATFIPGSLLVAGTPSGGNPAVGISVPKIAPGQDLEINFSATIDSIPVPNPIVNKGTVAYKYTIDPAVPNGASGNGDSNSVTTQVNSAKLSGTKSADKQNATVGEIITYTIDISNTGNQVATNITVVDNLPPGTAFVAGSVTVNGLPVPGATPSLIIADDLIPNAIQTVTYEVIVTEIPVPNPIVNNANVSYTFTIDPSNPNGASDSFITTDATTQVKLAKITMVKNAIPTDATIGTIVNYIVTLTNTGNVAANNILFKDILPGEVSFITGSVSVGGAPNPAANPNTGFTIATLAAGASIAVSFLVKVINKPSSGLIVSNKATTSYKYTINPANPNTGSGSAESNIKDINVGIADIKIVKEVDRAYATIGDVVNYTLTISNTGNTNANNVIVTDSIPNGTSFVIDSLAVNGVIQVGANPTLGYNIGSIPTGSSAIVTFSVKIDVLPVPNPMENSATINYSYTVGNSTFQNSSVSNKVTTKVNYAEVKNVSKTAPSYATLGQIMTYTIKIPNTGNVAINNVVVTDIIPSNTSFIVGSAKVNGVSTSGTPSSGIVVGTINSGQTSTITFDVKVNGVANPNPMVNNATINYSYNVDPNLPEVTGTAISSDAITTVNFADLIGINGENFVKKADKNFAKVGEVVTYTLTIKNTGNTVATSVNLKDVIPVGTSYITGSLLVNGIPNAGNIGAGIVIPNIGAGQTSTVIFKVKIDTIPSINPIPNKATINYKYTADSSNPNTGSGSGESNTVTTQVNFANITGTKVPDKAIADLSDIITYTINLTNIGNVLATNVVINDVLQSGLSFVAGSVVVDGITQGAANPSNIVIGNINAGASKLITYKAKVISIPVPNPIVNNANVNYKYTVNPVQINGETGSSVTTDAITKVENADLIVTKKSDEKYYSIGDIILYTVKMNNTGNVSANNVFVKDILPASVSFVTGTVIVDGISYPSADPSVGFNIGTINAGNTAVITYNVQVIANPIINPAVNEVSVNYSYGSLGVNVTKIATAEVNINTPIIEVSKSSDVEYVTIGDEVIFKFEIKNTGNTSVENFNLQDILSGDLEFITGSVIIDGVPSPTDDPTVGMNIASISDGSIVVVTFKARVKSTASLNLIENYADYDYTFTKDPGNPNSELGEGQTNHILLTVSYANLVSNGNFVKSVNKQYAAINEEIMYTIKIKNTGNKLATSVVITDPIPVDTVYVSGSLIGSVPVAGSPNTGIIVTGGIMPNQTVTISYKIKATKVPSINPIPNTANIKYNFTKNPNEPNGESIEGKTNTVTTKINTADLLSVGNFVKVVDKEFVDLGEEVTFTINVTNTGNVLANNVVIVDILPAELTYVIGSLLANVPISGDLNSGINITNGIAPGQTVNINFKGLVTSIPSDNLIKNTAKISYVYTSNPSKPNGNFATGNSNETISEVRHGEILKENSIKASDKTTTLVGDIITYTISGTNTGNIDINNVIVKDVIQAGTSFVIGSVLINGIAKPLEDPAVGINVGTVAKGETFIVKFKVKINSSVIDPILNVGEILYEYNVNPNTGEIKKVVKTNTIKIKVLKAKVTIQKSANVSESVVGNIVRYSVVVSNTGELTVNDVIIKDALDSNLSYENNLTIDGVSSSEDITTTGVNLGSLNIGESRNIEFDVKVLAIPSDKIISNIAVAQYKNTVNGVTFNNTAKSNVFDIKIYNPKITMTKVSNKKYLKIGDVFEYTITVKNSGDTVLKNVVLTDEIPAGLSVQSIVVDGITVAGNLSLGIDIGDLAIGEIRVIKLIVKVISGGIGLYKNIAKVKAIAILGTNSQVLGLNEIAVTTLDEIAITEIEVEVEVEATAEDIIGIIVVNPELTLIKSVNNLYVVVGERVTYKIVIENTGDTVLGTVGSPIEIYDILSSSLKFIQGTVKIDGVLDENANIVNGIEISSMAVGEIKTITFDVEVISNKENPIYNESNARFSYLFGDIIEYGSSKSNKVSINVSNVQLEIDKKANKSFVLLGELIEYTVIIKNTGDMDALNVEFVDKLSPAVELVDGSFSIDNQIVNSVNLSQGINIGNIAIKESKVLKYTVKVIKDACKGQIINVAKANYNYRTLDGRVGSMTSNEIRLVIEMGISVFRQISIDRDVVLPRCVGEIEEINTVTADIIIRKTHIVETMVGTSKEGQVLTGSKLIIYGDLTLMIEYTELDSEQTVHIVEVTGPISSFVILNQGYEDTTNLEVSAVIESTSFSKICNNEVWVSIMGLLSVDSIECCDS
ncbi:MAG: isopeptide-forming domain-containing fimbrial protein [Clostridium sp.]|uniref:isopeptide-forming domain-containing fimbrial protein n=1 Tax=Clostridium sp. TaxID=1506 RepID=UPI003EE67B55